MKPNSRLSLRTAKYPTALAAAILAMALRSAVAAAPEKPSDIASRIAAVENGLHSPVPIKGEAGMNILDRMKFYNVPGVSVAVISNDRIDWAKGYGVMDVETRAPVTDKTLFLA